MKKISLNCLDLYKNAIKKEKNNCSQLIFTDERIVSNEAKNEVMMNNAHIILHSIKEYYYFLFA